MEIGEASFELVLKSIEIVPHDGGAPVHAAGWADLVPEEVTSGEGTITFGTQGTWDMAFQAFADAAGRIVECVGAAATAFNAFSQYHAPSPLQIKLFTETLPEAMRRARGVALDRRRHQLRRNPWLREEVAADRQRQRFIAAWLRQPCPWLFYEDNTDD